ncbi:MAG: hypothetical protein QG602_1421 [Verrucomicrobiota bacterium]|nr:hypothetical protein [Verrucomicrobiota bacterium]
MTTELPQILGQRRPEIRARWEALLRLEKPATALATPDILVHLFDHTLDEVLAPKPPVRKAAAATGPLPGRCDWNPLRPYFATLEQALLEALIWAQAADPSLDTQLRVAQVGELCERMRGVAHREILLLDGVCQCLCTESSPA